MRLKQSQTYWTPDGQPILPGARSFVQFEHWDPVSAMLCLDKLWLVHPAIQCLAQKTHGQKIYGMEFFVKLILIARK